MKTIDRHKKEITSLRLGSSSFQIISSSAYNYIFRTTHENQLKVSSECLDKVPWAQVKKCIFELTIPSKIKIQTFSNTPHHKFCIAILRHLRMPKLAKGSILRGMNNFQMIPIDVSSGGLNLSLWSKTAVKYSIIKLCKY